MKLRLWKRPDNPQLSGLFLILNWTFTPTGLSTTPSLSGGRRFRILSASTTMALSWFGPLNFWNSWESVNKGWYSFPSFPFNAGIP